MYGFVITTAGEAMLARAAAGEALVLDAVMVGRGVVESAAAAKALSALIDPVAAATSTAPAVSGNQISMTVEYRNDLNGGLEAGFALSEFGISAHVGDDPAALLYYGSLGDAPQPVKPASEGLDVHRFPVAIAVTGEVSVTLEYPAGGFLTEEDLSRLNYIPTSEKGKPGGVATLGGDGKVPEEQLPEMDYDPAGSAEKVQDNLDTHIADKENPHEVKADQVPYDNSRGELQSKNVQGAIDELYARMYGDLKVKVQVYENGTTTPIPGVVVTGIASEIGGVCYADKNGIATGYVLSDEQSATVTVKVGTDYIDLTGQTSQEVTVTKGLAANATIYATRLDENSVVQVTASRQIMITSGRNNALERTVPVHLIGGGQGGGIGKCSIDSDTGRVDNLFTGFGGQRGRSYVTSVSLKPNVLYPVVIGAGGNGAPGKSGQWTVVVDGSYGGATTFAGKSSGSGNTVTNVGTYGRSSRFDVEEAVAPPESPIYPFDDKAQEAVAGGQGGMSSSYTYSGYSTNPVKGSSPYGGNGASQYSRGEDARGPAAGGASGGISTNGNWSNATSEPGGNGGPGLFLIKV